MRPKSYTLLWLKTGMANPNPNTNPKFPFFEVGLLFFHVTVCDLDHIISYIHCSQNMWLWPCGLLWPWPRNPVTQAVTLCTVCSECWWWDWLRAAESGRRWETWSRRHWSWSRDAEETTPTLTSSTWFQPTSHASSTKHSHRRTHSALYHKTVTSAHTMLSIHWQRTV